MENQDLNIQNATPANETSETVNVAETVETTEAVYTEVVTPVQPVNYETVTASPEKKKFPVFGLVSMITGILSLLCFCLCCCTAYGVIAAMVLSIILGTTSIVFALVGKKKDGKLGAFGLTGIICSIVALLISFTYIGIAIIFGSAVAATYAGIFAQYANM